MTSTTDNSASTPAGESFAYVAQTFEGQPMTGTIDATDRDDASRRLANLKLRVMDLSPAVRRVRSKPLGGEDFAAFNQQLAHLSSAGLPIESGLRLIADDLGKGGLAQSIRDVSTELDRGVPLGDAFRLHARQFPPLYGAVIDAGVRAGNLPGVLLNLGRHVEFVARLRATFWRAIAYPLAVLCGLIVVLLFLRQFVIPQFRQMYSSWFVELPAITKSFFVIADWTPAIVGGLLFVFVGGPVILALLRVTRRDAGLSDLALPIPIVGGILRRNLVARWCDAMRMCIESGMDLPQAITLSGTLIGSPTLKADGEAIVQQIESGREMSPMPRRLRIIPPTLLAVVQLSADRHDLPSSLQTMTAMYQQQAELRIASLQGILTPMLILFLAAFVALAAIGLFAPILSLFGALQ